MVNFSFLLYLNLNLTVRYAFQFDEDIDLQQVELYHNFRSNIFTPDHSSSNQTVPNNN